MIFPYGAISWRWPHLLLSREPTGASQELTQQVGENANSKGEEEHGEDLFGHQPTAQQHEGDIEGGEEEYFTFDGGSAQPGEKGFDDGFGARK